MENAGGSGGCSGQRYMVVVVDIVRIKFVMFASM